MIMEIWKPHAPPPSDPLTKHDADEDHDEPAEVETENGEDIKEDDESNSTATVKVVDLTPKSPSSPKLVSPPHIRKKRKVQKKRQSGRKMHMDETPPRERPESPSTLSPKMFKPIHIPQSLYSEESLTEMQHIKKQFEIKPYILRESLHGSGRFGKIVGLLSPKTDMIDVGKENVNHTEDACFWKQSDDRLILAIADGVGSRNFPGNGALWSKLVVRLIVEESIDWENLDTHLAKVAERGKNIWQPFWDSMREKIEEREKRDGKPHSNCCTLTVAEINFDKKTVNWFVLGDSPIFKLEKKTYCVYPDNYIHQGPTECISSIMGVVGAPKVGKITDYDEKNDSILLMTDGLADWVMVNPATQTDPKIRTLTRQRLDNLLTLNGNDFTEMHMKCHHSEMKDKDHYTDEDNSYDDDWTVLHFSSKS
jgi:hypothetical protein